MAASRRKSPKPESPPSAAKRPHARVARTRRPSAKEQLADKMLGDLRERVEALVASADRLLARLS